MKVAESRLRELKNEFYNMMGGENFCPDAFVDKEVQIGVLTVAEPGREMEWHCHNDSYEYFIVVVGELEVRFSDGRDPMIIKEKEMGVIKNGVEHMVVFNSVRVKVVFITVPPEAAYI